MGTVIIIVSLVGISLFLSYLIRNLVIKVKKYEDVTTMQIEYIQSISNLVVESEEQLKKLDENGHFEADDELGEFFKSMRGIQEILNKYKIRTDNGEKESKS